MMVAADCATRADFMRAAEKRLAVKTARGHFVLVRWDAPRTRGRALILLNSGATRVVKCADIEAVEVP
jgi:hypothetical protein